MTGKSLKIKKGRGELLPELQIFEKTDEIGDALPRVWFGGVAGRIGVQNYTPMVQGVVLPEVLLAIPDKHIRFTKR